MFRVGWIPYFVGQMHMFCMSNAHIFKGKCRMHIVGLLHSFCFIK